MLWAEAARKAMPKAKRNHQFAVVERSALIGRVGLKSHLGHD